MGLVVYPSDLPATFYYRYNHMVNDSMLTLNQPIAASSFSFDSSFGGYGFDEFGDATGIFTAPISGRFKFTIKLLVQGVEDYLVAAMFQPKSGSQSRFDVIGKKNMDGVANNDGWFTIDHSVIIDLVRLDQFWWEPI